MVGLDDDVILTSIPIIVLLQMRLAWISKYQSRHAMRNIMQRKMQYSIFRNYLPNGMMMRLQRDYERPKM